MSFCGRCGAKFAVACSQCGFANPPTFQFCGHCGTSLTGQPRLSPPPVLAANRPLPVSYTPPHLAQRIRAEQVALESRSGTDGERKTITALFADLKGSTALIEGLDPEEARAIIDPALQLMMDAVHRYEGYVAQALGDGIFALFGAPIAHEDHPQRALYAALRMQEEMRRYSDELRRTGRAPLPMRVGVNTGEVVLRSIRKDDLHADYVPIGHSTNLAARMEQLAAPGSILVTAYIHKLTDGYFTFKDLGPTQIKGVEEPLNIYEVLGVGPLRTRLQVAARRGLTRFVGRQREMESLQQALTQAKAGHGQIVGTMGEPGLGKSRLFYEFKLLSVSGCLVLEAYSVSHGKATAYLPVIELLKGYFDVTVEDDERKRREKIGGKVLMLDRSLEDTLPYLFALLGIDDPTSSLQQMDAQIRRRRTFEALKKLFLRESLNQPLMLIFEDLHWIDSETQGFLDVLSESVASARILLLVNYRPEYRQEWGQKTYYTQLRLAPFGKDEAEEFLTVLLGTTVGTYDYTPLQRLILEKTEGTPFFMEEVVQTLAEEGVLVGERGSYRLTQHAPTLHIPTTVQGVLAARIDRLAPAEKDLLQQLAVIGREFPLSLMRHVVSTRGGTLPSVILVAAQRVSLRAARISRSGIHLQARADPGSGVHLGAARAPQSLARENRAGNGSLVLHISRRTLQRVSSSLQPQWEHGESSSLSSPCWAAGSATLSQYRSDQSLDCCLRAAQDSAGHPRTLSAGKLALAAPLMATKGYTTPEVEQAYTRALALCRQVGETPQLFPVLSGLRTFYHVRGECQTSRELGEQLLSLAQRVQDPALLVRAHLMLGDTLFWLGELAAARTHLEQGIALYNPQQHRFDVFVYGYDSGVFGLSYAALVLWLLGYPDQALKRNHEALALARELSHPVSSAVALIFVAWIYQLRREGQEAQEQAQAEIMLSSEQGFPHWLAWGTILRGWALAAQGQEEEGIAQIRQGMAAYRATGAELARSYFLALLVEAYGKGGQVEERLSVLAEALAQVEKTEERVYEAELYRLKGTLTLEARGWRLETGPSSLQTSSLKPLVSREAAQEAEECFQKAIEIAQRQQAKSLELRATVSLARLWQQHGKQHEAYRMLSEIYGWFTEGFDTKDLQEAKALLDSLESKV